MRTSESINELAAALSTAQAQMGPAAMNAVNPFLKNRYADLNAVVDAVKPALAANGLSFVQMPGVVASGEFGIALTTRLMHSSGQWLEDTFVMPMPTDERGKSIMQVAGSAISYARRYALAAMLGVVADEDADGNHSGQAPQKPATSQPKPAPAQAKPQPANVGGPARDAEAVKVALIAASMSGSPNSAGEKQLKFTRASLSSLTGDNHADASAIIRYVFGVDSSTKLTGGQASALIDWAGANKDNGYKVNPTSVIEARGIVNAQLVADGQGSLFDDEPNGAYQE